MQTLSIEQITQQTIELKNNIEKFILESFQNHKFDIQKQHQIKEIRFVSYDTGVKSFVVTSSYNSTRHHYANYSKFPNSLLETCDKLANKFSQSVYSGFSFDLIIYDQTFGWNTTI